MSRITYGCVQGRHDGCKGTVHYDGAAASDLKAKCACRCHAQTIVAGHADTARPLHAE